MIDKLKEAYNSIKDWFWALPVWKRAIFSSIIGAFGGSSMIGFFNKYALYYYSVCQDFRVQIEGVEYINLAITIISFAFIIISIAGTILIYSILKLLSNFFTYLVARKDNSERKKKLSRSFITIISIVTSLLTVGSALTDVFRSTEMFSGKLRIPTQLLGVLLIIFTIIWIGYIFAKSDSGRKVFTLVIVILGISTVTASLFNQGVYKTFLKTIKYGGELPIEIEYRKANSTSANLDGMLMIKTNNSLILKNKSTGNIEEIPIERVSKVIYNK
ncbi:hypothetical protein [Tenacibaculum amylolyticum]|uniref:hypothetical protein n=1 Tax=Tenacibaculum amylolyticum TaxID=104269 RepID=UPI003893C3D3